MNDRVHQHLIDAIGRLAPGTAPVSDSSRLKRLLDAQLRSRHLDAAAGWLQSRGEGFYTIGSSGHEGNAAVAMALRDTDPALLHYRSGAFYCARAAQVPGSDPCGEIIASLTASRSDQISGGRHKVIGNRALSIIPQTSTIASHLPRAVGLAFALGRAARLGYDTPWPRDAVVVASVGDASVNHSTAAGALNTAAWLAYSGIDLPLMLVCEDNGWGISTPTPDGWVANTLQGHDPIEYAAADSAQPQSLLKTCDDLAERIRESRRPAVLHMRCVRLGGHAGSDAEVAYRSHRSIEADLAHDPILATARALVGAGVLSGEQILELDSQIMREVGSTADSYIGTRRLDTAEEVMAPIRRRSAEPAPDPPDAAGSTLAQTINAVLDDTLATRDNTLVFGQDVAVKGGVYGVTGGLQRRHGRLRVFDSVLDEQAILGTALGASLAGFLPICEIQYLAYVHNAADQLRGEAATLPFFSNGQYSNGMVVRIASFAYQRGFGGHFHNDNSIAALRDIPGISVAVPSHPATAARLLRNAIELAHAGHVVVVCEPIALYHRRDLAGEISQVIPYGQLNRWGTGTDLALVTYGNGVDMSLRAAQRLWNEDGIAASVIDLQWLTPLPVDDLLEILRTCDRILVVDESRFSGGVAESVIATVADVCGPAHIARVASRDSFIPTGPAANLVLIGEEDVVAAARRLCARDV